MSTDYFANAVIGVEVDVDKVFIRRKYRCCDCLNEIGDNDNFCPNCGKKAWQFINGSIEEYEDNADSIGFEPPTLCGFRVVQRWGYKDNPDSQSVIQMFVVGAGVKHHANYGKDPNMLPLEKDIATIKAELKAKLEPLGLWEESKFGLWAVGVFS